MSPVHLGALVIVSYFKIVHLATRIVNVIDWNPHNGYYWQNREVSLRKGRLGPVATRKGWITSLPLTGLATGADKKRSVFLTVIDAKTYKQLRSLIAPAKPGEISYDELTAAMKKRLTPPPSEIVQRFKFNSRSRRAEELVSS